MVRVLYLFVGGGGKGRAAPQNSVGESAKVKQVVEKLVVAVDVDCSGTLSFPEYLFLMRLGLLGGQHEHAALATGSRHVWAYSVRAGKFVNVKHSGWRSRQQWQKYTKVHFRYRLLFGCILMPAWLMRVTARKRFSVWSDVGSMTRRSSSTKSSFNILFLSHHFILFFQTCRDPQQQKRTFWQVCCGCWATCQIRRPQSCWKMAWHGMAA